MYCQMWLIGFCVICTFRSVALETRNVSVGSDITDCNMKCPSSSGILELYRKCEEKIDPLLDRHCYRECTQNHFRNRLHLDASSGCWALRKAAKEDSCLYETEYSGKTIKILTSHLVLVQDPVLNPSITDGIPKTVTDQSGDHQLTSTSSSTVLKKEGPDLRMWIIVGAVAGVGLSIISIVLCVVWHRKSCNCEEYSAINIQNEESSLGQNGGEATEPLNREETV